VEAQDPDGANNELQYEWTFSDGDENVLEVIDTEFAPWIRHTFDEAGPYALRVRVTDSGGAATLSRIHRIQINPEQ
jgi:hypothetical protein